MQHGMSYYRDEALRRIREEYPDADESCITDRYEIGYWNGEESFIDRMASFEYPGTAYPGPVNVTEEEMIGILVRDGIGKMESEGRIRIRARGPEDGNGMSALMIRKMTAEDMEPLCRLLADPEVMKYLEPPFTEEQTAKFLEQAGLSDPPLVYAVEKEGEFIGYVIYHDYDDESMEIGWVLDRRCWGGGIASLLTERLAEEAAAIGKHAVIECVPEQKATARIAEKNGFAFMGVNEDGLAVFRL